MSITLHTPADSRPVEYGNIADFNPDLIPEPGARTVDWSERGLRITRLRLLSEPGTPFWDVSYCYGQTLQGEVVRVQVPFYQLTKGLPGIPQQIIAHARRDRVYAKATGILDNISTLN